MFFIFLKSYVQTRASNFQEKNISFNVVINYFYNKLLRNTLIHRTRDFFLKPISLGLFTNANWNLRKIDLKKIRKKMDYNAYSVMYFFDLMKYKKYLGYLNLLEAFDFNQVFFDKPLIDSPLMNKKTRMNFFFNKSPLYGYKFHFSGRFTRKQKAANL